MQIKLTKAIEILRDYKMESAFEATPDFEDSLKLAIAGLEAIRFARQGGSWHPKALLPGEQPEEITKGG